MKLIANFQKLMQEQHELHRNSPVVGTLEELIDCHEECLSASRSGAISFRDG